MIPISDQSEARPKSTDSEKSLSDASSTDQPKSGPNSRPSSTDGSNHVLLSEDGLVIPKKLVNPCLESRDKKDLHRELMFNQKTGKNVLNQKSELTKVLEKRLDNKKKKEIEEDKKCVRRNSFERKLEEQALKIAQCELNSTEKGTTIGSTERKNDEPELEFLRIRAKLHHAQRNSTNQNDQVNANTKILDNA